MKTFFSIIIFLAILIFFLPNLASTRWGNEIVRKVSKKYDIDFASATFSWKGPQIAYQFSIGKTKAATFLYDKGELLFNEVDVLIKDHRLKGDLISISLGSNITWKTLDIPNMTIRLGKMTWQNFGLVHELFSLIQLKIRINAEIPIWFQDTPARLKDGVLHLERTECLVDNRYEFALWNNIDFSKNEFDLVFGIPGSTLEQVLDLSHLPKNYTIPLKFTGPFNNPHLHKSDATGLIASLLIIRQLPLAPIPPAPPTPAARRPFPWN